MLRSVLQFPGQVDGSKVVRMVVGNGADDWEEVHYFIVRVRWGWGGRGGSD